MHSNPDKMMVDTIVARLNTPPVPGVCQYRYNFNSVDPMYCERKLFEGSEYCYWQAKSLEKYTPSAVESYFGSGKTLIKAVEEEISSGKTMAGAYLVDAPIGGSEVHAGSVLDSGQFVQADLSRAHMSYSNLRGVQFRVRQSRGSISERL